MPKKSSDKKQGVEPQSELNDLLKKTSTTSKDVVAPVISEPVLLSTVERFKDGDPRNEEQPETATRYEELQLIHIKLSPTNPRKTYDSKDTEELAESIKSEGVIQPVLVRPHGKPGKYQLVFGERRYKASQLAGKTAIPALIRVLTDEQVLNMQITENLQRKDVRPIEEAVSYKLLMDMKGWTVTELAHRLGKTPIFIAGRLKLNDLIEEYQKAMYEERLTIVDALKVCKLTSDDQRDLYVTQEFEEGFIQLYPYHLSRYMYDLTNAPFDITDDTLLADIGIKACTTCQFNTACANLLFAEDDGKARCTYTGCFKNKSNAWFDRELTKAKEDPAIVLVSNTYSSKIADEIMKDGNKVYNLDEFEEIEHPGEFESYSEEGTEEYGEDLQEWQEDIDEHAKEILTATKAFVVDGQDVGKYIYVKLESESSAAKGSSEEEVKASQIKTEIARIEDKEKRQQDLDWMKVLPDAYKWFDDSKTHNNNPVSLTIIELAAVITKLNSSLYSWDISKSLKAPDSIMHNDLKFYHWLKTKPEEFLHKALNMVLRYELIQLIRPTAEHTPVKNYDAAALIDQANAYFPEKTKELIKALDDKKEKRNKKLTPRLTELRDELKLLEGTGLDKAIKKAGGKKVVKTVTDKSNI
jgi:ParB/RepB/Spo0J family partition protein